MSKSQELVENQSRNFSIHKVGGVNMSKLSEVEKLAKHLNENDDSEKVFIVSAFSGVTDLLLKALDNLNKAEPSEAVVTSIFEEVKESIEGRINKFFVKNSEAAQEAQEFLNAKLELIKKEILTFMNGQKKDFRPKKSTFAIRDKVIGLGEGTAAGILAIYFRSKNIEAESVLEVEVNKESHDEELHEQIQKALGSSLEKAGFGDTENAHKVWILGGHVGNTPEGIVNDVGRSYSDTTAVDVAVAINNIGERVERVVFWKDVDGVLSANPKLLGKKSTPKLRPDISLTEGLEIARAGSSLLQVDALELAYRERIQLALKNIEDPAGEGTSYGTDEISTGDPFKVIDSNPHDCLTLDITSVAGQPNIIGKLTEKLGEEGISINDILTGGNSLTFTFVLPRDEADKEALRAKIRRVRSSMKSTGLVEAIKWDQDALGNIVVVGNELQGSPGILATIEDVLAAHNISNEGVTHDTNQKRISIYVKKAVREKAVRLLHMFFFDKNKDLVDRVKMETSRRIRSYTR